MYTLFLLRLPVRLGCRCAHASVIGTYASALLSSLEICIKQCHNLLFINRPNSSIISGETGATENRSNDVVVRMRRRKYVYASRTYDTLLMFHLEKERERERERFVFLRFLVSWHILQPVQALIWGRHDILPRILTICIHAIYWLFERYCISYLLTIHAEMSLFFDQRINYRFLYRGRISEGFQCIST